MSKGVVFAARTMSSTQVVIVDKCFLQECTVSVSLKFQFICITVWTHFRNAQCQFLKTDGCSKLFNITLWGSHFLTNSIYTSSNCWRNFFRNAQCQFLQTDVCSKLFNITLWGSHFLTIFNYASSNCWQMLSSGMHRVSFWKRMVVPNFFTEPYGVFIFLLSLPAQVVIVDKCFL